MVVLWVRNDDDICSDVKMRQPLEIIALSTPAYKVWCNGTSYLSPHA